MDFSALLCPFIGTIQDMLNMVLGFVNTVLGVFNVDPISLDLATLLGLSCD